MRLRNSDMSDLTPAKRQRRGVAVLVIALVLLFVALQFAVRTQLPFALRQAIYNAPAVIMLVHAMVRGRRGR